MVSMHPAVSRKEIEVFNHVKKASHKNMLDKLGGNINVKFSHELDKLVGKVMERGHKDKAHKTINEYPSDVNVCKDGVMSRHRIMKLK